MKKETVEVAEPQQQPATPRIEEIGEPEPDPLQEKQTRDIAALQKQAHATLTSLTELRIQVAEMERMAKEKPMLTSAEAPRPEGIYGVMIADIYCPECGLKLDGNSATGPKFQYYVHPFAPSPRLGGEQCKLRGRKFLAPKIFLPMVL